MSLFVNHVGFNLATDKLQIVEINFRDGRFLIENIDEEPFSYSLTSTSNESEIIAALQKAYNLIIARKNLNTDIVSFALPDSFYKVAKIPFDDNLMDKDLNQIINWEFSVLFPQENVNDFLVDKFECGKNKLIFFALNKRVVQTLRKFCSRNNLILKYIDDAHIASTLNLTISQANYQPNIISCYIADNYYSLIFSRNNVPYKFNVYDKGKLFSEEFGIKNRIDSIKNSSLLDRNDKFDFIIWGEEVNDELCNKLQELLGYKIKLVNPFENMKVSTHLVNNSYLNEKYYNFSSAAGLAARLI